MILGPQWMIIVWTTERGVILDTGDPPLKKMKKVFFLHVRDFEKAHPPLTLILTKVPICNFIYLYSSFPGHAAILPPMYTNHIQSTRVCMSNCETLQATHHVFSQVNKLSILKTSWVLRGKNAVMCTSAHSIHPSNQSI